MIVAMTIISLLTLACLDKLVKTGYINAINDKELKQNLLLACES